MAAGVAEVSGILLVLSNPVEIIFSRIASSSTENLLIKFLRSSSTLILLSVTGRWLRIKSR